ncbi:MAG: type 2 isopentenyl-diphosphate Delta-isomerase [Saprospiraceae bacterium]|nr:type 2 isopentenyl-diphosphate Delta-isomerase [Saprospiraceae bacterium]
MAENTDTGAKERKRDHIELAFRSRVNSSDIDSRFYYEPLLGPHPDENTDISLTFLGKKFNAPIWVSSMTGGTAIAGIINKNLAKACGEFGLGMGLGSCRQLLYENEHIKDFAVRKYIGDQPLYANLGIAQLEVLIQEKQVYKVTELLKKLETDGLIVHVNPMQEWLQPEGDRYKKQPIETILKLIDMLDCPIVVKEVGQGMGPESLRLLLDLPLAAIDFGAAGGTNFAMLEILRSSEKMSGHYSGLANIGHSALQMTEYVNQIVKDQFAHLKCKEVIISGGISDFLDGYYLTNKLQLPSIYGQASGFLKHAQGNYEALSEYVHMQIEGFKLAKSMLKVR